MNHELPEKFPCPNCFASIPVPEKGAAVTCAACGVALPLISHLCADCGTYHEEAAPLCETCGATMTTVCQRCRTLNWAGNSHCTACGAGLDVIEMLLNRSTEGTTAVAQQQRRDAHTLKWQESLSSAERMEQLEAKEVARQAELRRREQIMQERSRQLWRKTAVAIVLIIFMVAIATWLLL